MSSFPVLILSTVDQIWVTTETLRSDWALALAKDAAKDMMLSRHEERVPLAASAETAGTESGNESEPESGNRSGAKGEEKRSDAESAGADYAVSALASIDDDESESRVEADVTVEGHISGYDDSVDGPSTERGFDELKK